ncbi:MAG: US12 family protein [Chloroflexi bacterium]|nr:US12 family protein [Chloroflexota bacterium]
MSSFPTPDAREGAFAGVLSGGLLGKVFGLLAFSIAFAAVGGAVGYRMPPGLILPLFLAELGLIFAVNAFREREGLNLLLLYAFSFVSGLTIGPLIASYVSAGAGAVVLQAVAITGVMTVGLSGYALTTKRNFEGLRPYLFIALLGLIVASIVNIFVGGTILNTVVSWGGAFLFSVLLIVDVNRTKYATDTMGNAVVITLGIYLDIVNLFLFVMRILNGGRR